MAGNSVVDDTQDGLERIYRKAKETGHRVFVAFSYGNLQAVAHAARKLHLHARLVLAADNDASTPGNPGLTKAREAAHAVGACVAVPPIPGDFNDWAAELRKNHGTQL